MEIIRMLSGARPSNAQSEPSGNMEFGLRSKNFSKPLRNSEMVKETLFPIQAKQTLKNQEKVKARSCTSKTYGDQSHEQREYTNEGILFQPKTSGNRQLSAMVKTTKDDELVRYMSNLPGYLQRMERAEDVQGKAFNVGVLDWTQLQNWKSNQKFTALRIGNNTSLPGCNLSAKMTTSSSSRYAPAHNETHSYQSKQRPSLPCRKKSSQNEGSSLDAKAATRGNASTQDVENASKGNFDRLKQASRNYKSSDWDCSDTISSNGKRRELDNKITSKVENRSFDCGYSSMLVAPKEISTAHDSETKQIFEETQGSDIMRKASKQKCRTRDRTSTELRNYDNSLSREDMKSVENNLTQKRVELQESATDVPSRHQADTTKNIILLLPRKRNTQNSFQKQPRYSCDENVADAIQNTLSDSDPERNIHFSEPHYEIPHSCPLPSRANINKEQLDIKPEAINTQNTGLSSGSTGTIKSSDGSLVGTSKMLDQDTAEVADRKGRHPSPNRRFSFSLGRMTRSFSFKESSGLPQLSSTYVSVKSGPVVSQASANFDNSSREKGSDHNRVRSSPLRRILDPLLKTKGLTPSSSGKTDKPLIGTMSSYSFKAITDTESLKNEKYEISRVKAQLMVTTRNGLPLFRFMINNNNIIVAAPLKNLALPRKNDPGCNYALYTIDEIKKKSGSWINQVSKEKGCGFVYNVVGQMKLNTISSLDLAQQKSSRQYVEKESVMFGVDLRQTTQASQRLMPTAELAAIVVKVPSEISTFDEKQTVKEESQHLNCCTVILPGGTHSSPSIGAPTSLLHRWRTRGSCDCGGWDVGCKLRILSSEDNHQKLPWMASNCFELFVQGETKQDRPIFSMEPIGKDKHSLEFSPSISLLQAFFISVTVLSRQKPSDSMEGSNMFEEKVVQESGKGSDGMKRIRTTVLGEGFAKYTPSPPVSPVGRV